MIPEFLLLSNNKTMKKFMTLSRSSFNLNKLRGIVNSISFDDLKSMQ